MSQSKDIIEPKVVQDLSNALSNLVHEPNTVDVSCLQIITESATLLHNTVDSVLKSGSGVAARNEIYSTALR